jgi:hypothetical protein
MGRGIESRRGTGWSFKKAMQQPIGAEMKFQFVSMGSIDVCH